MRSKEKNYLRTYRSSKAAKREYIMIEWRRLYIGYRMAATPEEEIQNHSLTSVCLEHRMHLQLEIKLVIQN